MRSDLRRSSTGSPEEATTRDPSAQDPTRSTPSVSTDAPTGFPAWVESRHEDLVRRWRQDVLARVGTRDTEETALLEEFFTFLLVLLPSCLGPYRSQFEPLWRRCSELYGSVGAMRGLAAGEIIEEFQFLREGLIRYLFTEPPAMGRNALLLREVLRLNRVIDRGVTYANVGHTDALFFALFQGSGAPRHLSEELLAEVRDQLADMRAESDDLLRHLKR